jgi:long-chain acyl-CoA synthetase
MLHHFNYREAIRIHDIRLTAMTDKDVSMNFLPLTHVFEKAWTYLCIHRGVQVCINLRPADIQTTIKEIRPTLMCSVPRFWEKVYAGEDSAGDRLAESDDAGCHQGGQDAQH